MATAQEQLGIKYDEFGNAYRWSNGHWRIYEDRSVGENLILGAGQTFRSLQLGAMQTFGNPEQQQRARELFESEREARQFLAEDAPVASGIGRALPYAATAPLSGGSVTGIAGVTALDAGIGALEFAETGGDRVTNALLAGAGTLGGFGLGAMASRVARNIARSNQVVAQNAQAIGARAPGGIEPGDGAGVIRNTFGGEAASDAFLRGSAGAGQIGVVGRETPRGGPFASFTRAGQQVFGEGVDSPMDAAALLKLREEGMLINPSSVTGNPIGRMIFDWAERAPQGADIVNDMIARPNIDTFNRMVFEAMGDTYRAGARVAELDQGTVAAMRDQSGRLLDEIKLDAGIIRADMIDRDAIAKIADSYEATPLRTDTFGKRLRNFADELNSGEDFSADRWLEMRGDARDLQLRNDGAEARSLARMVEVMDDALERALADNPTARFTIQDYNTANARFRLARALDKTGVVKSDGSISVKTLSNRLRDIFKAEWGADDRFGTFAPENMGEAGEAMSRLFDVTKAATRFPRYLNDSGTSQRLSIGSIFDSPTEAATTAITRVALPRWINRAQLDPETLRGIIQELAERDEAFRGFSS